MEEQIRLIVGLGNPDDRYRRTRHNIGREFVDFIADAAGQSYSRSKGCDVIRLSDWFGTSLSRPVVCARLPTFMNVSGPAVRDLALKENVPVSGILVVLDDFMIPFGSIRLRPKGSSGGHNGLKSIFETFGTEEVPRLRLGVGPVPEPRDPADYVLDRFTKAEQQKLPDFFKAAQGGLVTVFESGLEKGMNQLNRQFLP